MPQDARTIVMAGDGWHRGVIGIVAAKLAEEYDRPTILVSFEGESGRGSARSVPGFNLLEAIRCGAEHLGDCGGHATAAGLVIARRNLDAFSDSFEAAARRFTGEDRGFTRSLMIDLELELSSIGRPLLRELSRLAPHGEGNPDPLFATRQVSVAGPPRRVGAGGAHVQLVLRQAGASFRAVGFRMAALLEGVREGSLIDIAYTPRPNHWNGREEIELLLRDVRF